MMKMAVRNTAVLLLMATGMTASALNVGILGGDKLEKQKEATLERLMEKKQRVAGKVGAMKQKLTKKYPEALEKYEKIVELKKQVEQLNEEVDAILSENSEKYRDLLQELGEISRRYEKAMKAQKGKEE